MVKWYQKNIIQIYFCSLVKQNAQDLTKYSAVIYKSKSVALLFAEMGEKAWGHYSTQGE